MTQARIAELEHALADARLALERVRVRCEEIETEGERPYDPALPNAFDTYAYDRGRGNAAAEIRGLAGTVIGGGLGLIESIQLIFQHISENEATKVGYLLPREELQQIQDALALCIAGLTGRTLKPPPRAEAARRDEDS